MKLLYYWILCLVLTMALSEQTAAQSPLLRYHKPLKGKKNYTVDVIYQDKLGYIWIGTSLGLVKYDGIKYQQYTTDDSLASNAIKSLAQDTNGYLWIGHGKGAVSWFDGKKFRILNATQNRISEDINKIVVSEDNKKWFGTAGEGIFFTSGDTLGVVNADNGLSDNYVYCITRSPDNNIWIGTDNGITVFSVATQKPSYISMKDGLPDNIVKDIRFTSPDLAWIAMEDAGVALYNLANKTFTEIPNWQFAGVNNFVVSDDNQELWISTKRNGIVHIVQKQNKAYDYHIYNADNGLLNNKTQTVVKDNEGNVWMGSVDGITQFTGNLFEFLTTKQGLTNDKIFSFVIDNDGAYWIASEAGLFKLENSRMGTVSPINVFAQRPFENTAFISVFKDNLGYIWAGTYENGVFRIEPRSFVFSVYDKSNGLAENSVIHITGNDSTLWFSTLGGGASTCKLHQKNITFTSYNDQNGLVSNYVYATHITNDGTIWWAQDGGVSYMTPSGVIKSFTDTLGFESNVAYGFAHDTNNNVWITSPKGVFKYNGQQFQHFTVKQGLQSNEAQSIASDNEGNIIVVCNEGITVLTPDGKMLTQHGEEDGVGYTEPNINAIYKDKSGAFWIGTNTGLIKYNPESLNQNTIVPRIFLTRKKIFLTDIPKGENNFSHSQNNITFEYLGLWYKDPEHLIYRYKLDNYSLDWSVETRSLSVTYSELPPGKYTFRVAVSNESGVWIESPDAVFEFTIRPPFWQTWWFITLSIITVVVSVYLFFRIRLARLRRDKERLEEEVLRRTEKIEQQKEELKTQADNLQILNNEILAKNDEIEDKNKQLTDSIQYASRIQTAVLPPAEEFNAFMSEHFIVFRPRNIVSGDFYWANATENRIIIAAADCTGHGVPGAFMSMLGISFLNEIVNKKPDIEANQILNHLRENVKTSLRQTGKIGEAQDGMDMSLCIIEKNTNQLQYAGANNSAYLIRNKELIELEPDSMPIGIYRKEKESFTNHVVETQTGDCFYMFTDGFPDQFGGDKGKKFLYKQFKQLLLDIHQKPFDNQREILVNSHLQWRNQREQTDDVLVIGFKL